MEIIDLIKNQINIALSNIGVTDIELNFTIETPPKDDLGDFSSNVAFLLTKRLRKSPQEIAQILRDELDKSSFFEKVDNVNGFLNFFVSPQIYQRICSKIL
ncbi:arginyl-tRNA synthetase, partial [Petrotoga halophila DSM 16923]